MSSRRRGRKKGISSADKWKNKMWIDIKAPIYLDDRVIGETPSSSEESVIGRTVRTSVMDMTNSFKDVHRLVRFKITELKGNVGHTEFDGYELSRDYIRSMIRNHRSRVDGIFNIKLTDDTRIRITIFCVTPMRAKTSEKKEIRKIMSKAIENTLNDMNFPTFVNSLIENNFAADIQEKIEDYFPVKVLEVSKVKVFKIANN